MTDTAPSVDANNVIKAYVTLRDRKAELKKVFDAEEAQIKAKLDRLEAWLLKNMDAMGTSQLKSPEGFGTAYIRTQVRASCADWGIFHQFLLESGRLDFMEKRVSSKAVQDYVEEHKELPPGINIHQERVVTVNRR